MGYLVWIQRRKNKKWKRKKKTTFLVKMSNDCTTDNVKELTFSEMKELRNKKTTSELTKEEEAQLVKYYLHAAYVASGEMSEEEAFDKLSESSESEEARGTCCFCGGECNPCSQSCGRCARAVSGRVLGWNTSICPKDVI